VARIWSAKSERIASRGGGRGRAIGNSIRGFDGGGAALPYRRFVQLSFANYSLDEANNIYIFTAHELPRRYSSPQTQNDGTGEQVRVSARCSTAHSWSSPSPSRLAYTRYCFVYGLVCTNQYYSLRTHLLFRHPTLRSSPTLLRNILFPPDPPLL